MKNLFSLAVLCPFWINIFSQQLFVTKRDYSDPSNYIHSLVEIDQEDGSTLSSYDFITEFINSYSPESFVFNEQTNQIIGIAGRTVVKYNPTTNAESSFELPELQSVDYGDLLFVNNSLFVTKRDYSDPSNYIHSLVEIDQEDGSTLSSYDFITEFINSYSPESFVFNEQTNQIIGIAGRTVVKYNPTTNAESSFELPELQSVDYGDLVMIHNNTLGLNKPFQQIIKLQPIKAYNLLGKEVPTHTKNEIIIVLFGNGTSKKIFVKK